MRTFLDCIPCFVRQTVDSVRNISCDEAMSLIVVQKVLKAIASFDLNLSPPEMAQVVHRIIRDETGNPDPYLEIKDQSTKKALEILEKVQQLVDSSRSCFETAVRFSIAGNIMDFGVFSNLSDEQVMESFDKAEHVDIDTNMINALYEDIKSANSVLFLADNAGESVFDKRLIECMPGNAKVIYAVKGSPIINDVTFDDAKKAGVDQVANIISNGADVPGTSLSQSSKDFIDCFNSADVIIAKGQGNFESLNTVDRKVYFLFQVKCDVIADHYGYNRKEWMVTNSEITRLL